MDQQIQGYIAVLEASRNRLQQGLLTTHAVMTIQVIDTITDLGDVIGDIGKQVNLNLRLSVADFYHC